MSDINDSNILIAMNDADYGATLEHFLSSGMSHVQKSHDPKGVFREIGRRDYQVLVLDLDLAEGDSADLVSFVSRQSPETRTILLFITFIKSDYRNKTCYPPINLIFQAFKICPFSSLKVVILGQDPYHGKSQANGLSFSVSKTTNHPPSLINIFKEIQDDINIDYPKYGDLSSWGKQGVLLLNSTLTVEEGKPGSHQKKGWETFTDEIIKHISNSKKNIVFMLWGNYSKMKSKLIDGSKHLILTSGHPSPMSANRGYWFGNKHFSKANKYLIKQKRESIQWMTL